MPRKAKGGEAEHPRVLLAEVLRSDATREKIERLVDEALSLNTLAWGFCPKCKQRVQVEIPDTKKRVDAVAALFAEAYGKPGTTDAEAAGVTLIVKRVWPDADDRVRE